MLMRAKARMEAWLMEIKQALSQTTASASGSGGSQESGEDREAVLCDEELSIADALLNRDEQ